MTSEISSELQRTVCYGLLALGFVLLAINHVTVVSGDPWLIPSFLQLH
jgi:hypothetical protein